jgi:hypothetical protein
MSAVPPSTSSVEPSLDDLRRSLDHAETEYICADFIDNTARRDQQLSYWRRRRDDLRNKVAAAEGRA